MSGVVASASRDDQPPAVAWLSQEKRPGQPLHVSCSPLVFTLWWITLAVIHVLCMVFNGGVAWLYWHLPDTYMAITLQLYSLSLDQKYDRLISCLHGVVGVTHGYFIMRMLLASGRQRQLAFRSATPLRKRRSMASTTDHRAVESTLCALMKQAQHQWQHLFGPRGLLGVQGEYFDTVVFCREVLETALQTSQAYRLSRHVPRVWLNRAYDAILITNCWSTTVINVRWSHPRQVALRRLLCLISDLVLDLVSTLVVPLVIAATYAADYDYDNNGLFEVGMYDDRWMLHFLNECNLVVVSSWLDLFGRLLFSFSALVSLQSVKTLLQRRPTGTTRVQPVSGPLDTLTSNLPQRRRKHRRCGCSELELSRNVFCVWGLVVLVLQAHAETLSVVGVCLMQVRPWLNRKPACLLVDINCKRTTSVGAANDIDVILNSIDEQVVQHLLVRHCPDMHVPASVQSLHQLLGFKIYNSSLVEWSPEAALTDRTHPLMLFCFLIRAHFKDGVLPAGMIDRNFPHSLLDIEIVDSNLMDLPSDLHQRWPAGVNLYLEKCSLGAHLPHTLFHMHLSALSLSGSISFADAPVELLERLNGIMALMLQSPVLQRLPESVAVVPSSLRKLFLAHTNISYLPDWMDNRLLQTLRVDLWGTPICAALSRNETTGLANASLDIALAVKNKKLRCKPYNETMYPLWLDDMLLSE